MLEAARNRRVRCTQHPRITRVKKVNGKTMSARRGGGVDRLRATWRRHWSIGIVSARGWFAVV